MASIHILSEQVANQIAAGEVVERPASVVKELLENALDAGATRIAVSVEAGGKKLIQVTDNGCGMVKDDAMLAFERHATSKIKNTDDLLNIATLGFRGEALPSIASVARMTLETCASSSDVDRGPSASPRDDKSRAETGTRIEINGGKIQKVEEVGLPEGTAITVKDLFFNVPARRKFLKAESTELSHIAQLVTHYALANPERHFELHSATNAMLVAPPVASHRERIYQVFGKETLDQLVPVAAEISLDRVGLPEPPPWRRGEEYEPPVPGKVRAHGFVSRPEIQKLNRNSIFVFVNGRLIRDRLIQHALTEAYRNILPPTVFPVVLLFLEMPAGEVDVNVHPSKTEVRFRQQSFVHDFVRDTVRAALLQTRPAPEFLREISAQPNAAPGFSPGGGHAAAAAQGTLLSPAFSLQPPELPAISERLAFVGGEEIGGNAAVNAIKLGEQAGPFATNGADRCASAIATEEAPADLASLATLKALGQVRESFILAVNGEGLWIIDQHVAHERVLFERILRDRNVEHPEGQRLLMPILLELTPAQQAVFVEVADEFRANGFEVEPFGSRTIAVRTAPAGVATADVDAMLTELLDQFSSDRDGGALANLDTVRHRIAASIACHAAIKVNMPLEQHKMEWLLAELAKTECPMTCPHGRPVVLRFSLRDIQRAFKRI